MILMWPDWIVQLFFFFLLVSSFFFMWFIIHQYSPTHLHVYPTFENIRFNYDWYDSTWQVPPTALTPEVGSFLGHFIKRYTVWRPIQRVFPSHSVWSQLKSGQVLHLLYLHRKSQLPKNMQFCQYRFDFVCRHSIKYRNKWASTA